MMILNNLFEIGQTVYLITDSDQKPRLIIGILIRPSGILYDLANGERSAWHHEIEITNEQNLVM
jgi:hypothetical protein